MANEIMRLREEHVHFRKLLDLLEKQLNFFHVGETPDYSLLTDVLHYMINYPDRFHHPTEDVIFARYVTYYRSHMDKEESDLFIVAETLLRDADWDKINAETMSRTDPMFGADIEQRYRAVYRHITRTDT
jgi:hemerythrin-like domain-containing protein